MKIYKIRRVSDGLYSSGGIPPKFTKYGKIWSNIGTLKNHFNQFKENKYYKNPYKNFYITENKCEVICFELNEIEKETTEKYLK
jgi:hypothetical protein